MALFCIIPNMSSLFAGLVTFLTQKSGKCDYKLPGEVTLIYCDFKKAHQIISSGLLKLC